MTQCVVDTLETIEIDEQDAQTPTGFGQGSLRFQELLIECEPIGEASQSIVMRQEFDLALHFAVAPAFLHGSSISGDQSRASFRDRRLEAAVDLIKNRLRFSSCQFRPMSGNLDVYPRKNNTSVERLCHIVIGSSLERHSRALGVLVRRNHDHRQFGRRESFPEIAKHRHAVEVRHHYVEQDGVVFLGVDAAQCLAATPSFDDLKPFARKLANEQSLDCLQRRRRPEPLAWATQSGWGPRQSCAIESSTWAFTCPTTIQFT